MTGLRFNRTAERPALEFWLLDSDGDLVDFSTGYTFTFKVGKKGRDAVFTKTEGITGAVGSGTEASGAPNVTVTFVPGELDTVAKGEKKWQIRATSDGLDRVYQGEIEIVDVVL